MINQASYNIRTADGYVHVTIKPVNDLLPNGDYYITGIYKLSDGVVGMGDITFNEDMSDWSYNGMDEFTYEQAEEIANFIKNYKDPEGADPDLLA
jgi:hypothetical protein